ncbi:flagellar protein FlgN [Enterovibrio coralii]|uniref:LfgN n=1 Tax=Enterovibrio coralii TaxID=294935 RepID=A0A135I6I2_9GAMM|nr:flagellar protein FlgN [Enterovibrio coralii]KXF81060.1 hypothetical protein ATN88_19005 [Enterovibrio coralii]
MAPNATQLIQYFLQTVSHDIKHYEQLLDLLKRQRVLYVSFDAVALQENLAAQQPLLNTLKTSSRQRQDCLKQLGLEDSNRGVSRLQNALPSALKKKAMVQWDSLQRLVEQCQQYNNDNGQVSASFHEMISGVIKPAADIYHEQP